MKEGDSVDLTNGSNMSWWNDRISSFRAGEGIVVLMCVDKFCNDYDYGGASDIIGPLESPVMTSLNDRISHVKVLSWNKKSVMVFKDSQCVAGYAHVFTKGYYNTDDLERHHIGNDGASGIYVEKGAKAILFEDENYQGKQVEIVGPARYCNGFPGGFGNDMLSSLQVFEAPIVRSDGAWSIAIESNESI